MNDQEDAFNGAWRALVNPIGMAAIGLGSIAGSMELQQIAKDAAHAEYIMLQCSLMTGKPVATMVEWSHRYPGNIDSFYRWIMNGNEYRDPR